MIPGSLVFCHSKGFISWAIRGFTKSEWNHVAVIVEDGPDPMCIAAEGHGVKYRPLSEVSPGGEYLIVPPPQQLEPCHIVAFMKAQVGDPYGFTEIVSIVVTMKTPKFLNVMTPNTWICSAVAAEAWRFAGWLHSWPDIYQVKPCDLFEAVI